MSSANRFASLTHQSSKVNSPKQPDEYENSFPSLSESTEIPKKFEPETVEQTKGKKTKVITKYILAPRSYDEEMRLLRANAYETLADKEKIGKSLIKTRMCHSVDKKEPCPHGDNCRFAHDLDELNVSDCLFHDKCYFVQMHNGVLCNHGEKICRHKHPQETKQNVFLRTGICQNKSPTPQPPTPQPLTPQALTPQPPTPQALTPQALTPQAPTPQAPTPQAPTPQAPTPQAPTPQAPTLQAPMLLTNRTPQTSETKDTTLVLRVPKELAIRALEIAMENGKTHIHLEIIE